MEFEDQSWRVFKETTVLKILWDHANFTRWYGLKLRYRSSYGSGETSSGMSRFAERGRRIPFTQEFYGFKENLRAQYADRIWQIRKAYLDENPNRQSLLALNISRISPASVYYNAAAILAETDLGSFWQFMEQTRHYRREWVEYLRDEKIFSSRRWFTTESEEPFRLSAESLDLRNRAKASAVASNAQYHLIS